jgi:hypothetical protein
MITIEQIEALAAERKRIRNELATIGSEIYAIREEQELPSVFRLSSYSLNNWDGTNYSGMDDIDDWEIGTPLLSICFYAPSWEDTRYVTFPQTWLTEDWKQLETERVAAIRETERMKSEEEHRSVEIAREKSERRTYERLKKKFELKENS